MYTMTGAYTSASLMISLNALGLNCTTQIQTFLDHPVFTNPVVIMADAHYGSGAVIGFTMKLTDCVIPNVIGVDINCGMFCFRIGPDLGIDFDHVEVFVRKHVPFGIEVHDEPVIHMKDAFPWKEAIARTATILDRLVPIHSFKSLNKKPNWTARRCKEKRRR